MAAAKMAPKTFARFALTDRADGSIRIAGDRRAATAMSM